MPQSSTLEAPHWLPQLIMPYILTLRRSHMVPASVLEQLLPHELDSTTPDTGRSPHSASSNQE